MSTNTQLVTTVATINNQQIIIIENGEKRVAVKPICEALGIDFSGQLQRLKRDEILNSTMVTVTTVGGDGKDREMVTIPFKFVFGWLFTIDHKQVKEGVREAVIRYKMECYDALYAHFTELDEYLKFRTQLAEQVWDQVEAARDDFKDAKAKLERLKVEFAEARALTIDTYRQKKAQLELQFDEEKGGE